MITYETHEVLTHTTTAEGALILKDGSHEARVWSVLPIKGEGAPMTPVQLKKEVGDETAKVGQGRAFKNGWIGKEGDGFVKTVSRVNRLHHYICQTRLPGIRNQRYNPARPARN